MKANRVGYSSSPAPATGSPRNPWPSCVRAYRFSSPASVCWRECGNPRIQLVWVLTPFFIELRIQSGLSLKLKKEKGKGGVGRGEGNRKVSFPRLAVRRGKGVSGGRGNRAT